MKRTFTLFLLLLAVATGHAQEPSATTKPRNLLFVSTNKVERTFDQSLALAQTARQRNFTGLAIQYNLGVTKVLTSDQYYNFLTACAAADMDLLFWGTMGVDQPESEGKMVAKIGAYLGVEGYVAFFNSESGKLGTQKGVSDFLQPIKERRQADPRFAIVQVGIVPRHLPHGDEWIPFQEWNGGIDFLYVPVYLDEHAPSDSEPTIRKRCEQAVTDWREAHAQRNLRNLPVMPIGIIKADKDAASRPQTDAFLSLMGPTTNMGLFNKESLTKQQWESLGKPLAAVRQQAQELNRKVQPVWVQRRDSVTLLMLLCLFAMAFLKAPLRRRSFLALVAIVGVGWLTPFTYFFLLVVALYELIRPRKGKKKADPPKVAPQRPTEAA